MRRGIYFVLLLFCFCKVNIVETESNILDELEITPKFLNIPVSKNIDLMQGWYYVGGNFKGKFHGGVDYNCNLGDKIYAAESGLAMYGFQRRIGSAYTFGNYIFIKHDNGYASLYAHLNKVNEKIKSYDEGKRHNVNYSEWTEVKKGDYVGDCGMIGADDVHLHFEVTKGKYAVERVDSYDLYTTKAFYPPNKSYTALGPKYLWETDPPEYHADQLVDNSGAGNTEGLLDKVKGLFKNASPSDIKGTQENSEEPSVVKNIQKETEDYDLDLIDSIIDISAEPGIESKIIIHAKNTGTKVWKKQEISLNVVGGTEANKVFRHSSWITNLRPVLLDNSEVTPGKIGTFTFTIQGITSGSHTLKIIAVEVGTWKQIGSEQSTINISVKETSITEEIPVAEIKSDLKPFEGIVRGIKDFADSVIDKVTDVIEAIPRFFGGGSGSNTPPESNKTSSDNTIIEVLKDTIPPEKPTLTVIKDTANTIKISWNSVDTGGSKELQYTVQTKTEDTDWKNILEMTTNTEYLFSSELFHEYVFRVRAIDGAGNVSEWSSEESVVVEGSKQIVLNEIAWSGSSAACPEHEWIELYNPTKQSQSLTNWHLDLHTSNTIQSILLSGTVEGEGYYLISHPNTFVSIVTPDATIPQNISISDTGSRIVLRDDAEKIIDGIDQSHKWYAGDSGLYPHTLERTSADLLSFATSTWRSSDSARYGISSGLCGQMTGSPRMSNSGYGFISNETLNFYPRGVDGSILLTEEENPYLFSDITISEKEKLMINPGVVMAGMSPEARFIINGEVTINGSEVNPVIITSRNDRENVSSSAFWFSVFSTSSPQPGDWQNFLVNSTGKLSMQNAKLTYGGNRFGASVSCPVCARSQVIANQGGSVDLSHTQIKYGYESGGGNGPDSLVYANGGTLALHDTEFGNGKRALHLEGPTRVNAESVFLHHFDLSDQVVFFKESLPEIWKSIQYGENTPKYAFSPILTVTSSYTLSSDHQFQFTSIYVAPTGILTVLPGSNVYTSEIKIEGKLQAEGGVTGIEIAGSAHPSSTFSSILFKPGSSGTLSNVRVRGGGYFAHTSLYPFTAPRSYMLWIDGASVSISSSSLIDSRRQGGIVVVKGGNLTIKDSEIGWYTNYSKLDTWKDYGIVGNNQSAIRIENLNFRKMDYVVELNQSSTLTQERMIKENFIDLYRPDLFQKNWFPQTLFTFQLW